MTIDTEIRESRGAAISQHSLPNDLHVQFARGHVKGQQIHDDFLHQLQQAVAADAALSQFGPSCRLENEPSQLGPTRCQH